MVIVVMGVAGAGKTTVGRRLAEQLDWPFHDADDFHAPESIASMRGGISLTDEHRAPWLAALAALIGEHVRTGRPMVLACSALSRSHRVALFAETPRGEKTAEVRIVHLSVGPAVLAERLARRTGHFFPPELLAAQLNTLETPEHDESFPVITVDASQPLDDVVESIRAELGV